MPANTPSGYPYPLPTEPVAEGAQAIRNLAEAVEARSPGFSGAIALGEIDLAAVQAFSSIPQTFDVLRLIIRARSTFNNPVDNVRLRVNDLSSASYYTSSLTVWNATTLSTQTPGATSAFVGSASGATGAGSHFSSHEIVIPSYSLAGVVGALHGQSYSIGSAVAAYMVCNLFGSSLPTGPYTKISLFAENGTFVAGSRAWLYGMKGLV